MSVRVVQSVVHDAIKLSSDVVHVLQHKCERCGEQLLEANDFSTRRASDGDEGSSRGGGGAAGSAVGGDVITTLACHKSEQPCFCARCVLGYDDLLWRSIRHMHVHAACATVTAATPW